MLRHLNAYSGEGLTATSANEPAQKIALLAHHGRKATLDICDYFKMWIGSVGHAALEREVNQPEDHNSGEWEWGGPASEFVIDGEAETRLHTTIKQEPFSGQFDYYCHRTKTLYDYKFTSAWGDVFEPEHLGYQQQGWNLRTLFSDNERPDPKHVASVMFFTDWSAAKVSGKYPEHPIKVFVHPAKPLAECRAWTRERIALHIQNRQAMDLGDALTPCTDAERWARLRKGKAPVYAKCESYCDAKIHCTQHGKDF
jgi:hypothetical protein